MKKRLLIPALALSLLSACDSAPKASDSETEQAIAKRAADIRNDTDAEINRQIADIDASANAEGARIPTDETNAQ